MLPDDSQNYVNELGELLRAGDFARLKDFHLKWKDKMELGPLPSDSQLEAQMHQLICEFPSLSDLHAESKKWLLEHDFTPQVEKTEPKTG